MQGRTSTDPRWKSIHEDGSNFSGETHPAMVALKTGKKVENVIMGVFDPKIEKTRWININAIPQYKEDETKPFQVYTTFEDITKRKNAVKKLKESDEKFLKVFNSNSVGMLITTNSKIVEVNEAYSNITKYGRSELLNTTATSLNIFADEDRKDIVKRLSDKKFIHNEEFEIRTKTGEKRPVLFNSDFIEFNGEKSIFTIVYDITERKKTEKALRESESRFHSVLDDSQDVIYRLNLQTGRYEYISPSAENVVGYSPDELIKLDTEHSFNMIHPDDRIDVEVGINRLTKNDKVELEYRQQAKSGEYRWISNKMAIIRDSKGQALYRDGNIRDITKRKLREEQMKITMEELKRSNEELERFAYVSSHDLQEPLRMVALYSQLLEKRYKDNLDSDAHDFIEYIVDGAQRMRLLIDDLLEFSRINNHNNSFENIDLEKILDVALHNLAILIAENNVNITHDPLPEIFADENQMLQVFQNLITNAIKFHGQKPPEIHISSQKGQSEWIFSIADNGMGIETRHQKQIFEVFKRLHSREQYPGNGIGLSIIKKIVTHHGGRIWVKSEHGKGSTFYFTIPT